MKHDQEKENQMTPSDPTAAPPTQRDLLNVEARRRREEHDRAEARKAEMAAEHARLSREQLTKRANDKQLAEAEADLAEKGQAARDARTKATRAYNAVQDWSKQHALRAEHVHAGVDKACARTTSAMHHRLIGMRRTLEHSDALVAPQDLMALASMFVVAQPEFKARLHELLDADVPAGEAPLCRVTDEAYAAGLAELKEASNEAAAAASAADAEHALAAKNRTRIDRGQMPLNGRTR